MVKKGTFVLLAACLFALAAISVTCAGLNDFAGTWKNADANGGVTKLDIRVSGSNVTIQAWGKCQPTDCDWGRVGAYAYAPNVSSNITSSAQALSAIFKTSFNETLMIVQPAGTNRLQAQVLTRFTDSSGRSNYSNTFTFNREQSSLPHLVLPTRVPLLPRQLAAPTQLSPPNGSVFSHYPRQTTLKWSAVSGAKSYTVEIDCYHCCQPNKWCADVGQAWKVVPNLTATSYSFQFVGAQPGRWRVWAVDSNGKESPKTGWWEFRYTK